MINYMPKRGYTMLTVEEIAATERNLTLIAGRKGLAGPVGLAHMVETPEIARGFVTAGEIIFTTGAGLSSGEELGALIQIAQQNGAAAMVINLGPYISSVPEAAVAFADAACFPVFTCPWEVRMVEIMHRISCTLQRREQLALREETALYEALLNPDSGQAITRLGLTPGERCRAAVLCARPQRLPERAYCLELEGRTVAVFVNAQRETLCALAQGPAAFGGVCAPDGLWRSYRQAKRLFALCEGQVRFFEDSGIYRLLLELDDAALLEQYCTDTLGGLLRRDVKKKEDLLHTLEVYLSCSGRLKEAAEQLGVHKNTVTNKLHRCEALMRRDLSEHTARLDVEVALAALRLTGRYTDTSASAALSTSADFAYESGSAGR